MDETCDENTRDLWKHYDQIFNFRKIKLDDQILNAEIDGDSGSKVEGT